MANEPQEQAYDIIFKHNAEDGAIRIPALDRGEPAVVVDGVGRASLYVGTNGTSGGNVKIGPVAGDKTFVALKEVYRTQLLVSPYAQSYIDVFETRISDPATTGITDTVFGEFYGGEYYTPVIDTVTPTAMVVYLTASSTSLIDVYVSYSGNDFVLSHEGDNIIINENVTSIQLKLDVKQGKLSGINWMRV